MLIEIILALLLGIIAGTIAGLLPGVHSNLIAVFLVSASVLLIPYFPPIVLVVFIVAMATCQSFLDFIPSIFLGAPDEDSVLSILPGHEFLIKGKGYEAIILTAFGSLASIAIVLLLTPLFILFLPAIYPYIQNIMPFVLITASFFLIYFEKTSRSWAIIIFLLAGFLGIASLNLNLKEPLLPMLTGLFGASSLITSIMKKQTLPEQKIETIRNIKKELKNKSLFRALGASLIASPLCSFIPALGSGQAAVIGSEVTGDLDRKEFLILLGSINTIVMGLSFVTLYVIGRGRTGSAVAVGKLISNLNLTDLITILAVIFIAGIIAFFLTIFIAKFASRHITRIKYNKLSVGILILLSALVLIFSGLLGFLVFIVSASLGLTCIFTGIRRIHLMACLLVPTILIYLL